MLKSLDSIESNLSFLVYHKCVYMCVWVCTLMYYFGSKLMKSFELLYGLVSKVQLILVLLPANPSLFLSAYQILTFCVVFVFSSVVKWKSCAFYPRTLPLNYIPSLFHLFFFCIVIKKTIPFLPKLHNQAMRNITYNTIISDLVYFFF